MEIHLLILACEFPWEPLCRAADPLQRVGGIQHPAFRRAVEYLDRRLAGLRTVKSIAATYVSINHLDFMIDRVPQKFVISTASIRKLNVDVSTVNPRVMNFFKKINVFFFFF